MKILTILTILIFLGTTVNASCRTTEDFFVNITIPNNQNTQINFGATLIGDTSCYSIGSGDDRIYQNIFGDCYWNGSSPINYDIKIVNGTCAFNITGIDNSNNLNLRCNSICIGTCPTYGAYVEIRLNGTGLSQTLDFEADAVENKLNVEIDDWERHYLRKWTYKDETTNELFNFTTNPATMNVYCDSYSTFTVNLTDTVGDSGYSVIQTKERPKYSVNVNTFPPRTRQDSDYQLNADYILTNNTNETSEYTWTLQDYTGGNCYQSTLKISKSINDTIGFVDVQQFSQDNIIKSFLINNTNYGFTVVCEDLTRNIGSILVDDLDLERNILISTPEYSGYNQRWENLSITTNTDYDSSAINCLVSYPTTVTTWMNVYNWSNNIKTLDSSQTTTGTNVTFTYTAINPNITFWIECGASNTEFNSEISKLIYIRNSSAYYKGFDIPMPTKVLGLTREFIFAISAAVLTVILISLGSGLTYTLYTPVAVIWAILMWYVGWLPGPYTLYIALLFMAIMLHLVRKRRGT